MAGGLVDAVLEVVYYLKRYMHILVPALCWAVASKMTGLCTTRIVIQDTECMI